MFAVLMSLGLVAVVGLSGYAFSRKMDALFSDHTGQPAGDTQLG